MAVPIVAKRGNFATITYTVSAQIISEREPMKENIKAALLSALVLPGVGRSSEATN
jgi:hypothetical protein